MIPAKPTLIQGIGMFALKLPIKANLPQSRYILFRGIQSSHAWCFSRAFTDDEQEITCNLMKLLFTLWVPPPPINWTVVSSSVAIAWWDLHKALANHIITSFWTFVVGVTAPLLSIPPLIPTQGYVCACHIRLPYQIGTYLAFWRETVWLAVRIKVYTSPSNIK